MPMATTHSQDAHGLVLGHLDKASVANGGAVATMIKTKLNGEQHVIASTVSLFEEDNKPGKQGDAIAALFDTDVPAHTPEADAFVDGIAMWMEGLTDPANNNKPYFKTVEHY
ncbi:MAG: hypothetical protein E6J09_06190 [Chloroflexi bacterium]|nr:MAG: hypothetical protein E6J09_06190 [Chloroflexota bacterium]